MTRAGWLVLSWVAIAVVIWNAVFDAWMAGATREYLLQSSEFARGVGPEPDLAALMADARAGGIVRASVWALVISAAGLATIRVARR